MSDYGLTDAGLVIKTLEEIKLEVEADARVAFGDGFDLSPQTVAAQHIGPMVERIAEVWQLGQAIYDAFNPDAAAGVAQDNLCALTGTARSAPTLSKVIGTCCGTPGTVLPLGRATSVQPLGTRFLSAAAATITAVDAWQSAHAYNFGDRCTSDGKVWRCMSGGTTGGSGAEPVGEVGSTYTESGGDGVSWRCLGEGDGAVDVQFNAQNYGPLVANAGTLNKIESPVAGWTSVYNLADAYYLGTALEPDALLRLRREAELRAQGNAAVEAIRQSVLAVADVIGCYVFDNPTDVEVDGLPPHTVEAVVQEGTDAAIRAALFSSVGGGIGTAGDVIGSVVDAQGISHTFAFSRPTILPIYVTFNLTTNANEFPVDGAAQVVAAALAYGANYTNGRDVVASALGAQAFHVPGVLDCPLPLIGSAPGPVSSNTIPIDLRTIARLDSARIVVNVTPGIP